jgi:thiol:disulfide interchange protein DsbD
MNKIVAFVSIVLLSLTSYSQILDPVKWSTSIEKISESEYDLIAEATIDPKWHLYSQIVSEEGIGPIPTTFIFEKTNDYELVGKVIEEEGLTVDDPVFDMKIKYFEDKTVFKQRIKVLNESINKIIGEVEYMACDDVQCTPPTYRDLVFTLEMSTSGVIGFINDGTEAEPVIGSQNEEDSSDKNLWTIFFIAFLFGFTALLTPCVFPMIPLTVSYFTKQSKNKAEGVRNAIIYGISIIIIYVLLGTVVSAVFGPAAMNSLATNVWFNLFFFALLIVFAVSFLGAFEIVLPSSWGNKVDEKADKGGIMGIFFMALALAIVSFSCTGPIVGTLLVEAASGGNQIGPVVGMLGFSLAIALPFALFAAFPGWLNSLPKSGGWLNTVKVFLGFLELALAFKFLSNADLVLQLHFLEREVFLAIWIPIFGTLTLYLFGKIRLPHDSPVTHISVGRLSMGLLTLTFTIYMIPGLWGAPLNLISAFPPAQHYSESPYGVGFSRMNEANTEALHSDLPEGAHLLPPHNIMAFNDYEKGLAYAKKVNKPVLIDFTGHACVNCRKMEQNVWAKDRILPILKNEIVLISLYVDDKRKLSDQDQVDSKLRPGKKLRYIGQKWSEFQTLRYKANSQPYYVLMDLEEENLIAPIAYTPDVDDYFNWLRSGIDNFK